MKEKIQKFGKFLSGMVMPNIGAFIAWGFITAFFIASGWFPNEKLAGLVDPMLKYLLPILVGYTGGKVVAGVRGGVIGSIATMGVIVGADIPMFIGAMIMGPLSGYIIKKFDKAVEGKVPAGFEMLVNNFSVGIIGMILAIVGFYAVGPFVVMMTGVLKGGVEFIISKGLLPLVSIFIEPAKVLFLNNAINHGIIGPIGIEQAQNMGKSIMFLLESNPGPGLGVLLAYWMCSKGAMKESAPGAAIIHALGGIHEIYFPYVLMNPLLLLAPIAGSAAGILVFSIFKVGLVATPSPGSIFAILALAPKGEMLGVLLGILAATAVSFLVAAPLVKKVANNMEDETKEESNLESNVDVIKRDVINKIVFACDAGMGSSAMGATKFRNRIKKLGLNIEVTNSSVDTIPSDADLVVSHVKLIERAKKNSTQAEHVFIENFLQDKKLDELFNSLQARTNGNVKVAKEVAATNEIVEAKETSILNKNNIVLGLESVSKEEAIKRVGEILAKEGYVKEEYIQAMLEREEIVSTYIGMGVAIPHGVGEAKKEVKKSGIAVLQYPNGIKFGDEVAYLVVGIAGVGDEHLTILSNIAMSLEDEGLVEKLRKTYDVNDILKVFNK
ncbi:MULTISPECIES: PTS mannitol transporter subunit IICBA [Clostridia]|mgnify:FL=1|uniref:Mannitol-specific phosphotransferase enzyme IIA component n=2 Tax=Clostridia TaxID=186801 RepID=A0A8I0AAC0_9CLOT|nr:MULTISPECIES: PTS mannitol transporter subunit IICBA [Clostridia]MBC5640816.1 PTS mannitol transporter subunit IICBA [Clostridium lentum]MBC5655032.1 PTS mannitol transporter subunit IICBA [Blautia lenta]CDB74694.1 pTS system mannitol-specific IIABC component [Clostridium sp. CAG:265]